MPEIRDQAFPELLKKVYKTGITYTAQDALVKLTIDGELKDRYMDFSYKALPHFKEDKGAVLVMATDVTEKVLAKRQLEESERNLRHVIEQSPVAMCLFRGPKFVVELSNERMFDIWGRSKEEIIGKPIFEGLPEAKDQGFEEALERVYTTGETFSAYEVPVSLPRNGQLQTVFLNYVYEPIRNGEGYIYGIVAVGIEVTDLVQARQKIEDVVAQRTRELAEANKALQHSNGELARSNKNLEEFAYAASHDMKEPIRKIHVFSDRLKESFAGNLSATQQHYFDRLKSGAQRMSTLIDDLLSFSQVNVLPIEMQPVDLNDIITQVLQDMEIGIEEKGAIVQIDKLPVINGYPRQLQQAFQNLLGNALKFHKPDEPPRITISSCTVEGSDLPVTLGDNSGQNSYYLIEVADNGIGFKEEEKEKIFNLFTRLHGNAEYKGTGIGLSIVRKIAENHNGFVIAKGESSKGATFQMYLPVYRKA
jgi:PAS domain S-box-containing protein